jgi:hypothetical protein
MRLDRTMQARAGRTRPTIVGACLTALAAILAAGCAAVLDLERGELRADGGAATEGGASDPERPSRYAAAVLADGPLAYYPFLDPPGAARVANRAAPASGGSPRERDGVVAGATLDLEGALGPTDRAIAARSPETRIDLGWNGLPSGNEPFAIELALRAASSSATAAGQVLSHRDDPGGVFTGYRLVVERADIVFERVAAGGERVAVRALGVLGGSGPTRWTHLVASFDGARMRLIVDGEVADEVRTSIRVPGTGTTLAIGSARADEPPYDGAIDEVALYKEEIAPEKIATHVKAFR